MESIVKKMAMALAITACTINSVYSASVEMSAEGLHRSARIVNGKPIGPKAAPFLATMTIFKDAGEDSYGAENCGGTLISPNKLLTAAHCFGPDDSYVPKDITIKNKTFPNVVISFGNGTVPFEQVYLTTGQAPKEFPIYTATKVACHPDFNEETFANDICVLTLNDTITDIEPIALNVVTDNKKNKDGDDGDNLDAQQVADNISPGTFATVIGYGTVQFLGDNSGTLNRVSGPIVDTDLCRKVWEDAPQLLVKPPGGFVLTNDQIVCVDHRRGDSCQGDSGGPLINEAVKVQIGVVSLGVPCPTRGIPAIYTNVAHYHK